MTSQHIIHDSTLSSRNDLILSNFKQSLTPLLTLMSGLERLDETAYYLSHTKEKNLLYNYHIMLEGKVL